MFGGPKFGSPFSQTQQSTFGAKPTPFGGNTFGQQQSTLFSQPSTNVFGQTATPAFGATAPTFGQPATTQSAFGSFGQPQQTTTSLFGQTQNAQGNTLFGQQSTSTGFGAAKPGGFSGFNSNQPSLFGQPSSTSTASTGFGTFGNTATSAFCQPKTLSGSGTAVAKYQPHNGTDTLMKNGQTNSVNTRQHCITAMKEYENKCIEELRFEDYTANRKGPQAGSVPSAGLFGSTQQNGMFGAPASQPQSTGLFGAQSTTNTLGFGANTSAFGQSPPAFGAQNQTTNLFNKPANAFGQMTSTFNSPQSNNLFGSKPFGSPTTTASTGFTGFGAPAQSTATPFGAAKPFGQPTTGLFGTTPTTGTAAGSAFGTTNTGFGAFGSNTATTQQGSLFGTSTNTGSTLFEGMAASTPNTGFGAFGTTTNTAAGGGLFAQKPTTGFGSTFGTTPATGGGFTGLGTSFAPPTATGFGSFGQPNAFNKPAATGFSGFGTSPAAPTLTGGLGIGSTMTGFGMANTSIQQTQQPSVPIHQQILKLTTSPYGDNSIFKDLKPMTLNDDALKPTNPAAQKAILESSTAQYKVSPKVTSELKVKPIGSALSKKSLFGGLEEFDSSIEESFSLKPNAKRLIIKPKVTPSSSSIHNQSLPAQMTSKSGDAHLNASSEQRRLNQSQKESTESEGTRRVSWLHSNIEKGPQQNRSDVDVNKTIHDSGSGPKGKSLGADKSSQSNASLRHDSNSPNRSSLQHKTLHFTDTSANDSVPSRKSFLEDSNVDISLINTEPHPTGIVLQRSGYYTIPPLDKLTDFMTDDGKCIVPNFTIGRKGYGNVFFGEPINVAGLNLDELVHFRHKEVIIYPDDSNKPPIGEGLNRKAQITLDQVWPHDKTLHEPIKDRQHLEDLKYEAKLRAVCDKHDTRFVEYRPETGSWVFKVDHFSKYGLNDSDEEDDPTDPKKAKTSFAPTDGLKLKTTGTVPKKILSKSVNTSIQRDAPITMHVPRGNSTFQDLNDDREMEYMHFASQPDQFSLHAMSPSTDLAIDMGTDSHKLQLMRASLFNDYADEFESKSVTSEFYDDRDSPDQIVPSKRQFALSASLHSSLSKEVSSTTSSSTADTPTPIPAPPTIREYDAKKPALTLEARKAISLKTMKIAPLIAKPKVATIITTNKALPLIEPLRNIIRCSGIAADVALYHGKRFKIGWNHSNRFSVLSTAFTSSTERMVDIGDLSAILHGPEIGHGSKTLVKQIKIFSTESVGQTPFALTIENHLKCQLKFSLKQSVNGTECPHFDSTNGIDALQNHFEIADQNVHDLPLDEFVKISLSVWSLCVALWGYQEELDDIQEDDHISIMLRRSLLSKWLEETIANEDVFKHSESQIGYLQSLLKSLTAHKVNEACDLAFSKNDLNLSLLLAQVGSGNVVRALVAKQLQSWRETEADKFIDKARLKAMMLVSGTSTFDSTNGLINIFEDLDWIKSLAVIVWYLCSPTASITDALLKYEEAIVEFAAAPLPPYIEKFVNARNVQDIRYHLLKLYSRKSHSLEALLNPATHSGDIMDFRLSWFLLQFLKSIGYVHCSKQAEAQLHVSFASQLENHGLWHWSIFVLLHIPDRTKREICVQEFLYRYIELTNDENYLRKESFIINDLGVPGKWIYWAKAVKAGSMKQYQEQADFLLKAKQWEHAHEVIMAHIAPDAIINDNTQYIKDLLDRFEDPRLVPNWSNQGLILLDYLDMIAKIESLKMIPERDIETRWEGLKPQLSELCSRISLFPCPTSKHRLCQSEIAQGLAILVNGMEILSPNINPCVLVQRALEKLPLPEEYAKQKMRSLLNSTGLIEILQKDSH